MIMKGYSTSSHVNGTSIWLNASKKMGINSNENGSLSSVTVFLCSIVQRWGDKNHKCYTIPEKSYMIHRLGRNTGI